MNFCPIQTGNLRITRNGLRSGDITVTPQGVLNSDALKVFSAYGMKLSTERNKAAAHTSGGHVFLRTSINLGIAECLEHLMSLILTTPPD